MSTFIIAECCSSWRFGPESQHLDNAYRMIVAAKECGADAAKFQFCSDPIAISQRRNDYNPENYKILAYPFEWLELFKKKCDEVGIEFLVTSFIQKDIKKINPLVKRFKVASAESSDWEFVDAHRQYDKQIIASYAFGSRQDPLKKPVTTLHCVCSYPTPLDQINMARVRLCHGLSDHTTSVLTGALAVAAGATIVEKHVRLKDTPKDNPDYPHSLTFERHCDGQDYCLQDCFQLYVENIRQAELAMGSGENVEQPCEIPNRGRRVKA